MARHVDLMRLSLAVKFDYLICVRCDLCGIRRHYLPAELIAICGDIEIERLDRRLRCDRCGKKEYIVARDWSPISDDERNFFIRRIEKKMRPYLIWRDEPFDEARHRPVSFAKRYEK